MNSDKDTTETNESKPLSPQDRKFPPAPATNLMAGHMEQRIAALEAAIAALQARVATLEAEARRPRVAPFDPNDPDDVMMAEMTAAFEAHGPLTFTAVEPPAPAANEDAAPTAKTQVSHVSAAHYKELMAQRDIEDAQEAKDYRSVREQKFDDDDEDADPAKTIADNYVDPTTAKAVALTAGQLKALKFLAEVDDAWLSNKTGYGQFGNFVHEKSAKVLLSQGYATRRKNTTELIGITDLGRSYLKAVSS